MDMFDALATVMAPSEVLTSVRVGRYRWLDFRDIYIRYSEQSIPALVSGGRGGLMHVTAWM